MNDDKPSYSERYLKGRLSIVKNPMDYWESLGFDDQRRANAQAADQDWDGLIELLTCFSRGQRWPLWTTPLFA
ncbi:MAG: hypothetical protein VXZ35_11925, partial [Pseudomonadota bacterium]|nr:hypothetical protein [Pseudomonadota bacterium]